MYTEEIIGELRRIILGFEDIWSFKKKTKAYCKLKELSFIVKFYLPKLISSDDDTYNKFMAYCLVVNIDINCIDNGLVLPRKNHKKYEDFVQKKLLFIKYYSNLRDYVKDIWDKLSEEFDQEKKDVSKIAMKSVYRVKFGKDD